MYNKTSSNNLNTIFEHALPIACWVFFRVHILCLAHTPSFKRFARSRKHTIPLHGTAHQWEACKAMTLFWIDIHGIVYQPCSVHCDKHTQLKTAGLEGAFFHIDAWLFTCFCVCNSAKPRIETRGQVFCVWNSSQSILSL